MATFTVGYPARRGPSKKKRFASLKKAKTAACSYSRRHPRAGYVDVMRNGISVGDCHKGRWRRLP